jgi:peptide/nickel transport system substrate-binding protein
MRKTHPGLGASIVLSVTVWATLVGCAAPPNRTDSGVAPSAAAQTEPGRTKRIVIGIAGDLPVLTNRVIRAVYAYTSPGGSEVEDLITDGLSDLDGADVPQAKLAEAVPAFENGLWKILPSGRTETTWRIRENARWHDGTPFTTDDLLFTMMVVRDRELPVFRDATYDLIEQVEASDARTFTVTWKQPFIQADTLFSKDLAQPMPKHLLEGQYTNDKANLLQIPFWSAEFVGAGPYRVKSFTAGSGLVLAAFDDYVLGRPKIDEIEVRFVPDPTTLLANVYSGAVDATIGRGIQLDLALEAKERWTAGQPIMAPSSRVAIFPQFVDPNPSVIGEVRFRRALMYALDRQQIVDTLQSGVTPVAHAFLPPEHPDYAAVQGDIVRYDYDPRQAARLFEEIGLARAPDGFYRDAVGGRLAVEIWASGESKQMFAVADGWRQAGIDTDPIILPQQRWNDREYVAKFPGFRMNRQPSAISDLRRFQSAQAPLPENNFAGTNYSRYMNPELDALIDRYFLTIPKADRTRLLGDIMRHTTSALNVMALYHDVQPTLVANRITGVTAPATGWDAHLWDVRS